ncbi:MAG: hypothetical protein PVF27_02070 [Gemmatimonadales bacterium]|jgi:hypothetical protein
MTATSELTVRVWVPEVWDIVELAATPDWTITRLKQAALDAATGRTLDGNRYLVKYKGAPMLDEQRTLGELEIRSGAPFIVLPARRKPLR